MFPQEKEALIAALQGTSDSWLEFELDDEMGRLEFLGEVLPVAGVLKPHGKGIMMWRDGSQYGGDWNQGKACGLGVETYADGSMYCGQFLEDMRHGIGVFTSAADSYAGSWAGGERQGSGISVEELQGRPSDGRQEGRAIGVEVLAGTRGVGPRVDLVAESSTMNKCVVSSVGNFEQGRRIQRFKDNDLEINIQQEANAFAHSAREAHEDARALADHIRFRSGAIAGTLDPDINGTPSNSARGNPGSPAHLRPEHRSVVDPPAPQNRRYTATDLATASAGERLLRSEAVEDAQNGLVDPQVSREPHVLADAQVAVQGRPNQDESICARVQDEDATTDESRIVVCHQEIVIEGEREENVTMKGGLDADRDVDVQSLQRAWRCCMARRACSRYKFRQCQGNAAHALLIMRAQQWFENAVASMLVAWRLLASHEAMQDLNNCWALQTERDISMMRGGFARWQGWARERTRARHISLLQAILRRHGTSDLKVKPKPLLMT